MIPYEMHSAILSRAHDLEYEKRRKRLPVGRAGFGNGYEWLWSQGILLGKAVTVKHIERQITRSTRDTGQPARPGQATVEFALVIIVLLAMLYGIMEISRLVLISAELQNAAREGVHYASLHPGVSGDTLKTNAINPKLILIKPAELNVYDPVYPRGGIGAYLPVQVTVTYTWTSWVNLVPDMSTLSLQPLGPIPMRASSVRLIEGR